MDGLLKAVLVFKYISQSVEWNDNYNLKGVSERDTTTLIYYHIQQISPSSVHFH